MRRPKKLRQIPLEQGLVDNPVLTLTSQDPPYRIEVSGAHSDRFAAFAAAHEVLVLITNRSHHYAILTSYHEGTQTGKISIEGEAEIHYYLGSRGLRRSKLEIASTLYPLIPKD